MLVETLEILFKRDLNKLKKEIESYKTESNIWLVEESIPNSAGNLCLHLIGNLNGYIGVGLAGTNHQRDRDLEFSLKNIPREELLQKIDETIDVVMDGLGNLTEDQMDGNFPVVVWEEPTVMGFTLIHLAGHLNYHLGQINYHRRLLDC
jgi:hypothetical protein